MFRACLGYLLCCLSASVLLDASSFLAAGLPVGPHLDLPRWHRLRQARGQPLVVRPGSHRPSRTKQGLKAQLTLDPHTAVDAIDRSGRRRRDV